MNVTVHESIGDVPRKAWNALAGDAYPFLRHEFLEAAEATGCVSPETGWQPLHVTAEAGGRIVGALPLYEKTHSWGEFVFDWAWANAYHRAGLPYYPKLVSAVPFTPAPSPKLLLSDSAGGDVASGLLGRALELARQRGCSSLHVQFPHEAELPSLEAGGLKLRKDCQFHWRNRGYSGFGDFLETFTSSKRKKARRDRRHVAEAGIEFRRLHGGDLDAALWRTVYRLISRTFLERGSLPYFNRAFFQKIGRALPDNVLVVLAERHGEPVATAVFFESETTLYGRYWGADSEFNALHFETCYYQGIDYCIETGKQVFEPGTQGEHKISRGFQPVATWSAHWLEQADFFAAIGDYLDEERRHMDRYIRAVDERSPYRADGTDGR